MPERIVRFIEVDRAKIDREAKTIPISFSSEYPALQRADGNVSSEIKRAAGLTDNQVYVEILDHDPANVDLSLLNNRGAFLDEHDEKDHLGVIERAEVASDKTSAAIIRMGSDEKAVKRFGQLADGTRPHISAGYSYTRFLRSEKLPNGRTAYRFAWKGLEISSVAIPADPTIGVARAYQDLPQVDSPKSQNVEDIANSLNDEQKKRMRILLDPAATDNAGATPVDETKIRGQVSDEIGKRYKSRAKDITVIADELIKTHGDKDGGKMTDRIRGLAQEFLSGESLDAPLEAFKSRCLEDVLKAKPAKPAGLEEVTDDNGQRRYSIQRAIQTAFKNREDGKAPMPDGLEGEVDQEIRRKARSENGGLGYAPMGFLVPHNASLGASQMTIRERRAMGGRMQRDSQATVFPAGGAFVPTTLVTPVIELLRNEMALDQTGYLRVLSGLSGNVVIPRQEAAGTAYVVSEIGALTASQQILGQISLNPKRVGSTQNYSKQLVMQSTPDAEAFIRDDHFKIIALQWDYLGIAGSGAGSQPLGITNTPGVQSLLFAATPTYIKLISMETALRKANVRGGLCYLSTPATKGSLKGVAEALTGATTVGGAQNAIWKPDNMVNGYPAVASNQVPGDAVILGAEGELIQALWGGLDIVVDIYTKAANAEVVVTFNTWGDYALRHPQSFIVSGDSGAQ